MSIPFKFTRRQMLKIRKIGYALFVFELFIDADPDELIGGNNEPATAFFSQVNKLLLFRNFSFYKINFFRLLIL